MRKNELSPIGEHAAFAAEESKLRGLREKATAVAAELAEADAQLLEQLTGDLEGATEDRALALVEGRETTSPSIESLRSKVDRLRGDLAVLRRAVTLQAAKVADARAEATAEAALAIMPEHRAAVSGILEALAALHRAIDGERDVRRRLTAAGYTGGLRDFRPPQHVLKTDDLTVAAWLAEARKYAV